MLNHQAFKTHAPKATIFEHTKPLFIIAGQDTLAGIGTPPSAGGKDHGMGRAVYYPMEVWKADFAKYFVPSEGKACCIFMHH